MIAYLPLGGHRRPGIKPPREHDCQPAVCYNADNPSPLIRWRIPMILYIIRHAWAGPYGDPAWPDDFQRPLTAEGSLRFAQVVRTLAERDFAPQIVATSPLVRCRQTAEIVARQTPTEPEVVNVDALMPGSDLAEALAWTAGAAAALEQIAWVGHAPDVGNLTGALVGDSSASIRFAKGAVAAVRFDGPPRVGQGELRWLATAKLLGC